MALALRTFAVGAPDSSFRIHDCSAHKRIVEDANHLERWCQTECRIVEQRDQQLCEIGCLFVTLLREPEVSRRFLARYCMNAANRLLKSRRRLVFRSFALWF